LKRNSIQHVLALVYAAALLTGLACVPSAMARGPATLSGVVRDRHGIPQTGAVVQLLRMDSTLAALVFTDQRGSYRINGVTPGTYSLKALGTSFLPVLREHLLVRSNLVVNLTLSTLFEAAQWMPIQRRGPDEQTDDWTWTLRTAANRPLLRLLEDGPLVVVSDDSAQPSLKARITTSSPVREFGMGGIHNSFELRRNAEGASELVLRAGAGSEQGYLPEISMGYRRQMMSGATFRSAMEFSDLSPGVGPMGSNGVRAMVTRSSERFSLLPKCTAEFGNEEAVIPAGQLLVSTNPFGSFEWQGESGARIGYRIAESPSLTRADETGVPNTLFEQIGIRKGRLTLASGLHQEIDLARSLGASEIEVTFYQENLNDPAVTASGTLPATEIAAGSALDDSATGLIRIAGPSISSYGIFARGERQLGRNLRMEVSAGEGASLRMDRAAQGSLQNALAAMHSEATPVASLTLRGRIQSTATALSAGYRWQPEGSITSVAAFDHPDADAYLSFTLRQPLGNWSPVAAHVEMLVDVQNLLAEGYLPFVTSDGRTIYFAQAQRSVRAGLAFTF